MAMTDYFTDCRHVEQSVVADGLGGNEVYETLGSSFKGLAIKTGTDEAQMGAERGHEGVSYVFHCLASEPLAKDDRVQCEDGGRTIYLRMTDNAHINTARSRQTAWKSYSAVSYEPAKGGLEDGQDC